MRGAVELRTDGCTDLQLDSSKHYIVTKWYGSSLAILEEAAFRQYLRRLIPPELLECIEKEDEGLEYWQCEINSSYRDSLPVFVVAASGNMDSAIEMTKKRHAA